MTTPANPDGLITWLPAQIDEDERVARAAANEDPPPWHIDEHDGRIKSGPYTVVHIEDSTPQPPVAQHIARHDPARVLREVEAKRRILDGHPFEQGIAGGVCGTCHGAGRLEVHWDGEEENLEHVDTEMVWPCPTVRLVASVYADREGFREEWRP